MGEASSGGVEDSAVPIRRENLVQFNVLLLEGSLGAHLLSLPPSHPLTSLPPANDPQDLPHQSFVLVSLHHWVLENRLCTKLPECKFV